jgi:Tetracyclin repressor-like, C-terminal domain
LQLLFGKWEYAFDMENSLPVRDRIVHSLIDYLKEHGELPKSVYSFCKGLGIEEKEFFTEFSSLEAVEGSFWKGIITKVRSAVESGGEWASFSVKQKLLAFLYAFFEEALHHRSLFLMRIAPLRTTETPVALRGFETEYKSFAESLLRQGTESREVADRGRFNHLYPAGLYLQLRGLIEFNLKDESAGFEQTDAMIEKSVVLAFDLLRTQAIESAVDLAKMMFTASRSTTTSCRA